MRRLRRGSWGLQMWAFFRGRQQAFSCGPQLAALRPSPHTTQQPAWLTAPLTLQLASSTQSLRKVEQRGCAAVYIQRRCGPTGTGFVWLTSGTLSGLRRCWLAPVKSPDFSKVLLSSIKVNEGELETQKCFMYFNNYKEMDGCPIIIQNVHDANANTKGYFF